MSKKLISLYIVAGLIFFIGLLVRQLPANLVLAHAANNSRFFIPVQVSGTLWQGQAANIIIKAGGRQLPLGEVKWTLSALSLLTGTIALDIDAQNGDQKISGQIDLGYGGTIDAENLKVAVDAGLFKPMLPMPVNYTGFVELDLDSFSAHDLASKTPKITALSGNLLLKDLAVNFGADIDLGTYGFKLTLADKKVGNESLILIKASDVDATVEADGNIQLLAGSQRYFIDVKLKPKASASPMIKSSLGQFYKKQADGYYKVSLGQPL